jgi:hypothetical protein
VQISIQLPASVVERVVPGQSVTKTYCGKVVGKYTWSSITTTALKLSASVPAAAMAAAANAGSGCCGSSENDSLPPPADVNLSDTIGQR